MPGFEAGDIVRAPFPYTDRESAQHRPALVVSNGGIGPGESLLWVVMITSADNRTWPDDVALIEGHHEMGLPIPSLARPAKIATINASRVSFKGRVPPEKLAAVDQVISRLLSRSGMSAHNG